MSYRYKIPSSLTREEVGEAQRFRQGKVYEVNRAQTISSGLNSLSTYLDEFFVQPTPVACGGKLIYLYNFTDSAISMIDSNNAISIAEPLDYLDRAGEPVYGGCIVIEVIHLNQAGRLSDNSNLYLKHRRAALSGLDLGIPAENCYNDSDRYDNILTKATENQRLRFVVGNIGELFAKYGGAFYIGDADTVIASVSNPELIWIHPKSSHDVKKKARPNTNAIESLGVDISINDTGHRYERAFINLSGQAVEVPIIRDNSIPDGVTIWSNVYAVGTRPCFYAFDDKSMPMNIYSNTTQAIAGGSVDKLIESKILEEKNRLAKEKADYEKAEFERQKARNEELHRLQKEKLERDRIEHERERIAKEREFANKEREHAHREKEHEQRRKAQEANERVENVSFIRKVLVEGAKAIAAVATTAAVLIAWYTKRQAQ